MNNYDSIYDVKKAWLEALGGDPSPATNDYEASLLLLDWYLNPPVPPVPPSIDYDGLIFKALESGSTIAMTNRGDNAPNLEYSFDGETWETWDYSAINLTAGQEVAFRGTNTRISSSVSHNSSFAITGNVEAKGDIMSILDGGACTARTVSNFSFYALFSGCASLKTAPKLPATSLGNHSYYYMFAGTSLTTAPELPATSLPTYCYQEMFHNCTSLTTAPELPTTALTRGCYFGMFGGCSSLTSVTTYASNISASNCLTGWLGGVASAGTFVKSTSAWWTTTGNSGVPNGWTIKYSGQTEASISSLTASTPASISTTVYVQTDSFAGNSWEITECPAWCTLSTTAKTGDRSEIVVTADFNTGASRSGNIVITATDRTITIPISQEEFAPIWDSAMTFTAKADNSTIGMTHYGTNTGTTKPFVLYTTDGGQTYSVWDFNTLTLNSCDTISMAAYGITGGETSYSTFNITGDVKLSGNIMSLLDGGKCTATTVSAFGFQRLFQNATGLTDAGDMVMPATSISGWGCMEMFKNCTNLTVAPEIINDILLGSTATSCFEGLFMGCTSLTTAPIVKMKTVRGGYVFRNWLYGCASLTTVYSYITTKNLSNTLDGWMAGVPETGDFYNLGGYAFPSGENGIPTGWTVHTSLPYGGLALTAQEDGCTIGATGNASLNKSTDGETWEAWDMSNITLDSGESVYFASSLSGGEGLHFAISGSVNAHGNVMSLIDNGACSADTITPEQFKYLFSGCTGLNTSGLTIQATSVGEKGCLGMFYGCTSLTVAPELPAITLAKECYANMFLQCTSLETAPELPATTLANSCYYQMFKGCTSLTSVTTHASDISAVDCLLKWLFDVSGTGDFYNLGGATYSIGESGIPDGWTEHNSL